MRILRLCTLLLTTAVVFSACRRHDPPPASNRGKLAVVTTLFPLYDFARTIGGDKAVVTLLLPPGVEPHSFEPKPDDLVAISTADLFVFTNPSMEPWAHKLLQGVASDRLRVVDASQAIRLVSHGEEGPDTHGPASGGEAHGHDHGGAPDPHVWLDFANARTMVETIATAMAEKDPANREGYLSRAAAYKAELQKLDDDFRASLANCGTREFLHSGHYAFGYLARRYNLVYHSAQAVNPDAEPTPARLAALVDQLRQHRLRYIYSEELLAPRTAEMIARETGAGILNLHGAHNISKDDLTGGATFISLMRKNLEQLRTGLQCR